MKCFLSVITHIVATALVFACVLLFVGIVSAAAIGTSVVLGLGGGWSLFVLAAYEVIAIGTIAGAAECWGE